MPHGITGNETLYYLRNTFKNVIPSPDLDFKAIESRETKALFERHNYYPADLFFFSYEGRTFFGRKTLSSIFINGLQPYKKCNQLTAPMLIGLVSRHQLIDKGVMVFHKPLQNDEKVFLFNQLKRNPSIDIYFPFPVLNKELKEYVQPVEDWDSTDDLASGLNAGEEHIRQYTINLLKKHNLKNKIIYDPACSTGAFLGTIKTHFPEAITIGQDINDDMIKFARKHSLIDQLHVGNSLYPCLEKESADFIIFRFLNSSVISSKLALKLFTKIAQCCKKDGLMILFGFTPVLLSAEIFQILQLRVQQTTAYCPENDSIIQYYVLKKTGPVPQLRYEDFSPLNIPKSEFFKIAKTLEAKEINQVQPEIRAKL